MVLLVLLLHGVLRFFKLYLKDLKYKTVALKGQDYSVSIILFIRTVYLTFKYWHCHCSCKELTNQFNTPHLEPLWGISSKIWLWMSPKKGSMRFLWWSGGVSLGGKNPYKRKATGLKHDLDKGHVPFYSIEGKYNFYVYNSLFPHILSM